MKQESMLRQMLRVVRYDFWGVSVFFTMVFAVSLVVINFFVSDREFSFIAALIVAIVITAEMVRRSVIEYRKDPVGASSSHWV